MAEMLIRPTMKFIIAGYIVVFLTMIAVAALTIHTQWPSWIPSQVQPWIPWLPAILLLWPLERHLRRQASKISILDDRLRYQVGILNKSTRTILISRVQDVTVHQRLMQRIFGVGDLSIETAGEASGLTIDNIDRPHEIADHITGLSEKGTAQGQGL